MPGFEWLGKEEKEAVNDVMDRGVLFRYEFGDARDGVFRVREFEEAFAAYTGAAEALAVSSGSAALKVALAALGIGPGDEVITQGFTFVATWEAILEAGARPVFCEVDETLCMDPADLEKKITERTRCIVPVHMLGGQADIKAIRDIAQQAGGIAVLEDSAQAAGCTIEGRHVGTFGDMGAFSFDPVKTLTTGEGGMVITNSGGLWKNASEYHDHGHDHEPVGRGNESRRFIGFNYRMMELQGAIGLAQLKKLPGMVAAQQKSRDFLTDALSKAPGISFRKLMDESGDSATFLSWFMETKEDADKLAALLSDAGAPAIPWGENTWHNFAHWEHLHAGSTVLANGWPFKRVNSDLKFGPDDLPQTKELLSRCLSYQIMLGWDQAALDKMAANIAKALEAW